MDLVKINGEEYFQCEECKFIYKKEDLAKKCERYCKDYKSCNLEITKFALKLE